MATANQNHQTPSSSANKSETATKKSADNRVTIIATGHNTHLMPIKKTKKSAYKALSKLNEDSLTELKLLDKPEYTSRVFYFNHATKAQLNHHVNTWFSETEVRRS
jgi:hypothetical protein